MPAERRPATVYRPFPFSRTITGPAPRPASHTTPQSGLSHDGLQYQADTFLSPDKFASFIDSHSYPTPTKRSIRHRRSRRPASVTKAKANDLHQAATTFKHQSRIAESADENRGLVRPSVFMQRLPSNRFPHNIHEMILFTAHHEPNPRSSRINYFIYFFAPFKRDQSALPIYFNDDPVDIANDTADVMGQTGLT
jgi:hypothetical protein